MSKKSFTRPHGNNCFYLSGCVTCGKKNISVEYFLERHICLECRKEIKYDNMEVKIFLNDLNDIVSIVEDKNGDYFAVDNDELTIFDFKCYATNAS